MLSKNFSLKEFTRSSRALSLGIDNTPTEKAVKALKYLVNVVLEPIREFTSNAIVISSGYRSSELNKAIGGANGSQHEKGEAADLESKDNARLFNAILQRGQFDQLIWEFGDTNQPDWVHVSIVDGKNRGEVLRSVKKEVEEKGKKVIKTFYEKF